MVTAETIRRVRLDKHQGKSYRRIAKDRNLDRKTVLKVLKSGLTELQYSERETQAYPYPQLGASCEKLEALLLAESKLDRRHRRKWTRVHEALQHEGFTGGYDSIRRYAKRWKASYKSESVPAAACTPMKFSPGEAFQFDGTPQHALLSGHCSAIQLSMLSLCYSRMSIMRAYPREKLEMVLAAHVKGF